MAQIEESSEVPSTASQNEKPPQVSGADTPRDKLAVFAALSPFATGLVVAVIGGIFTFNEGRRNDVLKQEEIQQSQHQTEQDLLAKEHQARILELQAVGQFMPYLVGKDEKSHQVAITAIKALSNAQLAVELAALNPSPGTKAALVQIAKQSSDPADRKLAQDALVDFEKTDLQPIFSGAVPSGVFQEADWHSLTFPDPRFVPGAIFEMKKQAPNWISSLQQCSVPATLLKPVLTMFRGGAGSSADIDYIVKTEYTPATVLKIPGVTAGSSFRNVAMAKLQQYPDTGTSVVNVTNLKFWFSEHANIVPPSCKTLLSRPDVYVAYEAYMLGTVAYSLQDSSGVAINLKSSEALRLSPNASASLAGDSILMLSSPAYVAVRAARIYKTSASTH